METRTTRTCDNRPIGVFDSGLGGLTVAAAMRRSLPAEDIVYLGDTARVPYGDRSVETIRKFAEQDLDFLAGKGVKAVVAACNTVSSVALEHMKRRIPSMPVLGVIESGVAAVVRSGGRRITVLGTRATVNSDAYRRAIHAADPSLLVESIACPLFVPFAEEGITSGDLLREVFHLYLGNLRKTPPDVLLLGCTHYPLLQEALREYLPDSVYIIDSAAAAAQSIGIYLQEHSIAASGENRGRDHFYVTDFSSDFHRQARRFFGRDVRHVEKISLA